VDNVQFFRDLQARLPHVNWKGLRIPQVKDSFYLFGTACSSSAV